MKSLLQKALLLVASITVGWTICELALRMWTPQALADKTVRVADPVFHHAMKPSASYILRQPEFEVEVKTNSLGLRDDEPTPSDESALRILILGDSFVEGYGVPVESCFVHKLQTMLVATSGVKRVRVYNFGVAGYSPIIEYLLLKEKGLPLRPHIVVLNYDMTDVQEDYLYGEDAEYDALGAPLRVKPSSLNFGKTSIIPQGAFKTWLHEKSYLFSLISSFINRYNRYPPIGESGDIYASRFRHTIDSSDENWKQYFLNSQKYIKLIAALCEQNGIRFILSVAPRGNQVSGLEWIEERKHYGWGTTVFKSAIFTSLEEFARTNHIPYLDMTPTFRRRSRGDLYFPIDGHWTNRGNQVAADTLYAFLLNHGYIDPNLPN